MLRRTSVLTVLFYGTLLSSPVMAATTLDVNTGYLNGLSGSKVTWEEADATGEDTVEINGKYYKYTYHKPDNYANIDKKINNTLATADVTNKLFEGLSAKNYGAAIFNNADNSDVNIQADFVKNHLEPGNAWGIAIYNSSKMGDITGDFVGNYGNGGNMGGGIWNESGKISNITGDFIGNHMSGSVLAGSAAIAINTVSSRSESAVIDNITGDFIGNTAKNSSNSNQTNGGAIILSCWECANQQFSVLGNVSGNFIGNTVEGQRDVSGGAITMNFSAKIGNITGDVAYNHAKGVNGDVEGGAFYLHGVEIGVLKGDYIGNYAESVSKDASGGAIHNEDIHVAGIDGDFANNSATSGAAQAKGGAITLLDASSADFIHSNFVDNHAVGETEAKGGAIYTNWTYDKKDYIRVGDMQGSFQGNSAEAKGENGQAYGGAIANTRGGYISMTNTSFVGNYAKGKNAKGGAVYNNGVINATADGKKVEFSGNYVEEGGDKRNEAIYAESLYDGYRAEINLATENGGVIDFDDSINGNDYDVTLSGDESGEVIFNNDVSGAKTFKLATGSKMHLGKNSTIDTVDYVSDGGTLTLDMKVNAAARKIDNGVINVSGDVVGNTKVIVNAKNPEVFAGAMTKFVNADNYEGGTAEQFEVARVMGSPYMWQSVINAGGENSGSHWYLSLTDEKNPDVSYTPEVMAAAGLHEAALEQTRSMAHRVSEQVAGSKAYCLECGGEKHSFSEQRRSWAVAQGEYANIKKPLDVDAKIWGLEAGFDLQRDIYNVLGIFVSYRQGDYDFSGKNKGAFATVASKVDIDSYLAGLYYRYDKNMNWAAATVYGGKQSADAKTDDGIAKFSSDGVELGASLEAGHVITLTPNWHVMPEVGLYYTQINFDDAHDNVGKRYEWDDVKQLEAEAGLRVEKSFVDGAVYVKPSVLRTFTSGDRVKVSGLASEIATYDDQTLGRLEIGGDYDYNNSLSFKAWINYTYGSSYNATAGGLDVNYKW